MITRLIKRYYPDSDQTRFYLVEVRESGFADNMVNPKPAKKPNGVVFLELWSGTWDEILDYAGEHEMTLPPAELWIYPDWPDSVEIYI